MDTGLPIRAASFPELKDELSKQLEQTEEQFNTEL